MIEAKIRIRQKELHDDGVQMLRREENRQTGMSSYYSLVCLK